MSALAHALIPSPIVAVVLAVAGAVAGVFLAKFAAERSVVQPLSMELEAETSFLTGVLADLRRLPYVTSIAADDFASGAHHRIWQALLNAAPECQNLPDDRTEDDCATLGKALQRRRDDVLTEMWGDLQNGPAPSGDGSLFRKLLGAGTDQLGDVEVIEAGHKVLNAGQDRNRTSGSGLVAPTSTPDSAHPAHPPLARVYTAPSQARVVITAAATALASALIPAFTSAAELSPIASMLGGIALAALIVLSAVVALVDIDTFYVDLRTFFTTCIIAWIFATAAVVINGSPGRVLVGLAIVVAVAALFEILNRLYRAFRGVDGQGFGDSLIVLATVGIPPALTGQWSLGYYSVSAGFAGALLGWIVGALLGKLNRNSPYAFGPYLAAGWVVGWAAQLAFTA